MLSQSAFMPIDHETYGTVFDRSPVAQILQLPFSSVVAVNTCFLALSGCDRSALVGAQLVNSGLRLDDELGQAFMQALRTQQRVQGLELLMQSADGPLRSVIVSSHAVVFNGATHHLHSFIDISQHKAQQMELKLAVRVLEQGREGIMVTDANRAIVMVNDAFTKISGYTQEDLLGKNPKVLSSGRQSADFFRAVWLAVNDQGSWQGEVWNRRKDGSEYPEWLTISVVRGAMGEICNYVGTSSDISEQLAARERITWLSHFDALTGLPNRTLFMDRLGLELGRAQRSGRKTAVLLLNLDHFKQVNDAMGHDQGDRLLVDTAVRIKACVRETDTVARLGGDEFAVIVSELETLLSVETVVQNLLATLAEPFGLKEGSGYISASIGVSFFPDDASDMEGVLRTADQAMDASKTAGGNRFCYFTHDLQRAAQNRMWLASELRGALNQGQFWIAYQPIIDLASGQVHKAEALIRWQHPVRGLISPAEFIPVAESSGLIVEIGDWVFREAAMQVKRWREHFDPHFQVSVNKSPVQFHRSSVCSVAWGEHLQALGLEGNSVVVEITEGVLLDSSQAVDDQLLALRACGIQVSLDDFGTGYSSLAYLQKHDIDFVKIDQSFVRNLQPHSKQLALCEAIVVMAHKLGIQVVAEGIETTEQLELLRAAGCEYGQGYLFARPMPAHELDALLALPSAAASLA